MSGNQIRTAEEQVRAWVDRVVVGLDMCPFAKRELDADRVRICRPKAEGLQGALEALADEAIMLNEQNSTATTLLVLASGFDDFEDYLDLLELTEQLMQDCGWAESLQLASFHPNYCFADVESDDPSNYSNRSPFPIVHLLRQDDVAQAIAHHPDVESIPKRNQALARDRGAAFFESILARCRTQGSL